MLALYELTNEVTEFGAARTPANGDMRLMYFAATRSKTSLCTAC